MKYFNAETYFLRVKNAALTGKVHSVFAGACNIQTCEGELVTLLNQTKPDQPGGIRITLPKDFNFSDWITSADRVFCQHGYLKIEQPNFLVDMRRATLWEGYLQIHLVDDSEARLIRRWEASAHLYLALVGINGSGSEERNSNISSTYFFPKLYALTLRLTKATNVNDWQAIRATICSLIGFGPGLTPWGDDFLCGFMAGLESLSHNIDQKNILTRFRHILRKNLTATGDISRSMLSDVLNGQHGRPTTDTCQALFSSTSNLDLSNEINNLIETGDTSGAATCLGILSGSAAAIKHGVLYKKNYKQLMSVLTKRFPGPNLGMAP